MWITFSASAPESGDSTSDSPQDFELLAELLEQSAWWRGKPSPSRVWAKRCKKGGWISVLFGAEICETFPSNPSLELIGYQGDILASRFPFPANAKGKTIGDICGPSYETSSGLFDLEECFSRTWLDTSHSVSVMCLQTWKDLVSDVRLACTQRRKSVRRIAENGCSSSAWPTPRAMTGGAESAERKQELGRKTISGGCLQAAVKNWPTPDCTMRPHEGNVRLLRKGVEAGMDKAEADAMIGRDIGKPQGKLQAWPTPAARDWKDTPGMSRDRDGRKGGRLDQLPRMVYAKEADQFGPHDPEKLKQSGSRPVLSPAWVETLMGFPIGWTDCGR